MRSGSITVNGFPFWIDQTPAPLFVVGGTISDGTTGVPGVTVTLGGSQSTTTMTDNYGAYLFNVAPGSYTLTPSHPSYSFAPTTTPYSTASGDLTAANFTATPVVLTISGRVSKDSIGLPGVTLTLGGSESGTATTNASGDYTFTVHYGRSYTVMPAHSSDTFSPALANFTQITTNQTMNFTASSIVYTISGNVTGAPTCVSGVTVNLTGSSTGGKTATTNASGSYAFSSVAPGDTYTVHPVKAGCSFSPGSLPFANLSGNQTANFTATAAPMVTITGRITNGSAGLPNITVNLSGSETTSKITGADGSYTFTVGVGGSYTVTPKSDDHSFEPTFRTFDSVSANQTADFSASPLYRISGRITNSSGAG
ncbi:MAG TPA: SdrD B-like domain-containing protein, partial [Clostridia bacterium]|nr:SdrD B-like domain-containing protein [Clostridia bacterium]